MHPVKQIYHCFGCGVGGDVFKFVMEMDKFAFPEAMRAVAEKCGIAIPRPRERTPEERKENQQRTVAGGDASRSGGFFAQQLEGTPEGKAAQAYLLDRGLDSEAMARFGIGFAPRAAKRCCARESRNIRRSCWKFPALFQPRSERTALFDRFRRRVMFPIANESGKSSRSAAARWATTCRNI